MDRLIEEKIATYKRHVTLKLGDGCDQSYIPGAWLGRPPFNVELRTLHVDRRFNSIDCCERLFLALALLFLRIRVVAVETDGKRVAAVSTQLGKRYLFALVYRRFRLCIKLVCPGFPSAVVRGRSAESSHLGLFPGYHAGRRNNALRGRSEATLHGMGVGNTHQPQHHQRGICSHRGNDQGRAPAGRNRGRYLQRETKPVSPL